MLEPGDARELEKLIQRGKEVHRHLFALMKHIKRANANHQRQGRPALPHSEKLATLANYFEPRPVEHLPGRPTRPSVAIMAVFLKFPDPHSPFDQQSWAGEYRRFKSVIQDVEKLYSEVYDEFVTFW